MSFSRFKHFVEMSCLTCCLSIATSAQVSAHTSSAHHSKAPKLAPDAALAGSRTMVPVIVQYRQQPAGRDDFKLQMTGAQIGSKMPHIKATAATVPGWALESIAKDDNVAYVSLDRPLHSHGAVESIATSAEYTVDPINAPAVWALGYKGTGVGVAVIDSGISNEADLNGTKGNRLLYSVGLVPSQPNDSNDHYGHGTHVAGLIGGNGNKSTGNQFKRTFLGVAPDANILNFRVLDVNGAGTDSTVIAAIEEAIALKSTYNIRVINLSLGRPIYESYEQDPLCQAVEQAWKAGIVVVVAAGNDGRDLNLNAEGYGTIEAPGNDPYVITVGATRTMGTPAVSDDLMASYSSKGPSFIDQIAKPDIVAPGNLVTSLQSGGSTLRKSNPTFYTPKAFYQADNNLTDASSDYMPLSGTSMATAVTSGAVALLVNAVPQLTPDQVKALLMRDANKTVLPQTSTVVANGISYTDHNDVFTVGAGYLDVYASVRDALSSTSEPAGYALSPTAIYNPIDGTVTLDTTDTVLWGKSGDSGTTVLWGKSGPWGEGSVYGQNAFVGGNTVLWGKSGVSGEDDPSAFAGLWGTNALWGSGTPRAAGALWGESGVFGSSILFGNSTSERPL